MLELQSSTYNKDTMPCTHLCHPGVTTLLTHVCNIWASCIILILLNLIVMLILEIRECMMSSTLGRLKTLKGFGQANARVLEIGDQDYYNPSKQSIYNHFNTVKHIYEL